MVDAGIIIRPVAHGDFAQLSALLNPSSQQAVVADRLPESVRRRIEGDDLHGLRLVAVEAGEIIGQVGVTRRATPARHGWVTLLVRGDQRRRGIGRALLSAVTEAAKTSGLLRLETDVLRDNAPALALYRQLGFTEAAEGAKTETVKMEKML